MQYKDSRRTNSQLQWRARERSTSPHLPPPPPLRRSPSTPPLPLERNLHESAFSKQIIPTTEEVLGELRDVTLQYIHCADPTESAARRLRVIQSEKDNLMANTASGIIAAAAEVSAQLDKPLQENQNVILLPHATTSIPVVGSASSSGLPLILVGSKRRGRPPCPKKANTASKAMGAVQRNASSLGFKLLQLGRMQTHPR
ncbi:Uncharacterized protein Rs2_18423 [Raphanus sativus]|nr:Uncharacterized protein Rs2_18423 [Raphanus sativus]